MGLTWQTTKMHTAFIKLFLGNNFPSLSPVCLRRAPKALRLTADVVTLSLTSFPNCRRLIRADETQALRNSCHTTELRLQPNAKCSVSSAQPHHLLPSWVFRQACENLLIEHVFLRNIWTDIFFHMFRYIQSMFCLVQIQSCYFQKEY